MRYGLIGEKLGHSYSKEIHESIADYEYEIHPVSKDDFDSFMRKKPFEAINVTIPYKEKVIPYLDGLDENARSIGAVNTIVNENGKYIGHNTDFDGFLYTVKKCGITVAGKKALVLGKGGASKAIIAALRSLGAKSIITVYYKQAPGCLTYEECKRLNPDADIIVNTTPVGMFPDNDSSPIDITDYPSCFAVLDVIYNPLHTKLLKQAESLGITCSGGLPMLVAQAVYASEYFRKIKLYDNEKDYGILIDDLTEKISRLLS